jgi:phage-related protein
VTQPIDVAYVDIVVRDKSLKQVKKDIKDVLDDVDRELDKTVKNIDDGIDDALDKVDAHFRDTARTATRAFRDIDDAVVTTTSRIGRGMPDGLNRLQRTLRNAFTRVSDVFDDLGDHFERGLKKLGAGLSSTVGLLGQLAGVLGSFVTSSPLLVLILALVPAIIALAAALSNLIGLVGILPSGLGVLIAAIVPVVVAFQNFGEAVSALASGDIDKINEALKKLSPSAALVAREVAALLPTLRSFQRVTQEAFFSQVKGSFTVLAGILPQIAGSFNAVAAAVGRLVHDFVGFLASARSVHVFNELFAATARIISTLTGPLVRFFDAVGSSVRESLPFIERIATALGHALDSFAAFLNQAIESNDFNTFIEDAFTTVKELVDLLKAVGGLLGTIFAGTEDAGHDLIKTLTDSVNELNAFFKSAEGQRTLQDLVLIVKALGVAIAGLVATFEVSLFSFHRTLDVLELIGTGVTKLGAAIGRFVSQALGKLREFGNFVGTVPERVGNALEAAVTRVGDFISGVGSRVSDFGKFLASIPSLIGDFIGAVFDRVLLTVGASIGLILFAIQVLPGKIVEFLASLPERVAAIFVRVRDFIINLTRAAVTATSELFVNGFNAVLTFLDSVPGRVSTAFTLVKTFIVDAVTSAVTTARDTIVNGFNAAVDFIASVPDKIRELVPIFARAGKNLIESFMNGFRSVGSFIGDIAGDIVGSVKGFLNRAIDKINSGIASIDAVLPGDLGRIPRLAEGAIVPHRPGGVIANVGEGSEDEVVAPLSKLIGLIRSAVSGGAGGVVFSPGAINVNFSGAVPTESEAFSVGQAVGAGIAATIARRGVAVRARAV